MRTLDTLAFPLRALFLPENSRFGLTSLRDERFSFVADHCQGRVLDVGCGRGNQFIRDWIGAANGVGVDVFAYDGVEQLVDPLHLPFTDEQFDTVTLIAVGGHMPRSTRVAEFRELARVLKQGGRLLMTEGEPITQTIGHRWRHASYALMGRQDMDSERGMEHDEQFAMPHEEIRELLNTPPLRFVGRKRFMWGLNNLFIAERAC
jgi:SAM-dependent methyltransferase